MSGWILAIDVGTTSTAAARRVGDRVEMIQLQNGPRMPSMVFWREGTGTTGRLVLGNEAEELSTLAPWCLERTPKSRLGEEFIQLGDKQLRPVEIVAAILREVYNEAISLSGGEPPSEIRLTHPARWQQSRLDKLSQAAKLAGLPDPVFVPEPVSAAVHFASSRLADGEHVAVYDLGGGTLDTAVLKRTGNTFEVIGRTGGDEELGGEDFDDLLYRHLGDQLGGETWDQLRTADERQDRVWGQANRELLRQARRAKEGLSRNPEYEFYLPPPVDQELTATVDDFEGLIGPTLRGTVAELERTILAAGLKPADMKAIYLAGGSSRIPLVGRLIQERMGLSPEHLDDPKAVIAMGAARLDSQAAERTKIAEPPLDPAAAAIPALPGADKTDISSPGRGDRTQPAAASPPPPPPPPPGGPGGAGATPGPRSPAQRTTGSPGIPPKKQSNRNKIIAGVAAAVVVLGGVAAAITLSSGGGGDSSTDTGTGPTTITDDTTDPQQPEGDPTLLKSMVDANYRDCSKEPQQDWEPNAILGLYCGGPGTATTTLEQFSNIDDLQKAFNQNASGIPNSQAFCADKWEIRTEWKFTGSPGSGGEIACSTFVDDQDETRDIVVWTDEDKVTIGFLFNSEPTEPDKTFQLWDKVIHE